MQPPAKSHDQIKHANSNNSKVPEDTDAADGEEISSFRPVEKPDDGKVIEQVRRNG
jgi:hypothetical protein